MILWDVDGVLIWHHPVNPALDWRARIADRAMLDLWENFQNTPLWYACLIDPSQDVYKAWNEYINQQHLSANNAADIVDIWMRDNIEFNQPALACLKQFHAMGIVCGIASNQDSRRAELVADLLEREGLVDLQLFISCRIGFAKPDPRFFAQVELETQEQGNDLIFLDDTAANVVAARERGWQTLQISPGFNWPEFSQMIIERNKTHE